MVYFVMTWILFGLKILFWDWVTIWWVQWESGGSVEESEGILLQATKDRVGVGIVSMREAKTGAVGIRVAIWTIRLNH